MIRHWLLTNGQEEQNRGKPNWEHLNDELHVLITVEDTENRALVKLARATEEIKKLLVPAVSPLSSTLYFSQLCLFSFVGSCRVMLGSAPAPADDDDDDQDNVDNVDDIEARNHAESLEVGERIWSTYPIRKRWINYRSVCYRNCQWADN